MNNTAAFLDLRLDLNPEEAANHQTTRVYVVPIVEQQSWKIMKVVVASTKENLNSHKPANPSKTFLLYLS